MWGAVLCDGGDWRTRICLLGCGCTWLIFTASENWDFLLHCLFDEMRVESEFSSCGAQQVGKGPSLGHTPCTLGGALRSRDTWPPGYAWSLFVGSSIVGRGKGLTKRLESSTHHSLPWVSLSLGAWPIHVVCSLVVIFPYSHGSQSILHHPWLMTDSLRVWTSFLLRFP